MQRGGIPRTCSICEGLKDDMTIDVDYDCNSWRLEELPGRHLGF